MYLLDTNVISETRKPRPHGAVLAWISTVPPGSLFLPSIALGELQRGVALLRQNDPAKSEEIHLWIDYVSGAFNILSPDGTVFREWAEIMHSRSLHHWQDALIAATARVHRLTVVTRNIKDFQDFGVDIFNPFTYGSEVQSGVWGAMEQ